MSAATELRRRCEGKNFQRKHLNGSSPRTRLCEKSVVQSACRTSVSVSSIRKSIALATSVRRRQLRKQFCASLAHATFHTAWNAGTHTPCRLVLVVPLDPFVETSASGVMGPGIPGCMKSPSFNLRVEHLSQFHRYGNQLHWQPRSGDDN